MPLVTFYMSYEALGFAAEEAENYDLPNAEAYLKSLLTGALNHERARRGDAEALAPLLPALIIEPRYVRDEDGTVRIDMPSLAECISN